MHERPRHWHQWLLIMAAFAAVAILLVMPLALIFTEAFSQGWAMVQQNLTNPDMLGAIKLTLIVALITVPVNLLFGILLAWCVTRYEFRGRKLLSTLIDIPFAMSPVVAGLCYLVVYGAQSVVGNWFSGMGVQLMFALPGMVMVTVFVTCPYVARVLIPLMESQGQHEEEAAIILGASGWQAFWYVTLPKIRWALLYGVVLTNARAVGEFGAVSVVSGLIRGQTLTLPLLVQMWNQDYNTVGAFTAAGLLAAMAVAIPAFTGSGSSSGASGQGLNPSAWSEKFGTGMFLDASPNSKMQPWRTMAAAGPMVTLMNTVQTYLNKLYCNFPDSPQPQAYDSATTATGSLAYAHNFSNDFLFKLANLTYADPSLGCQCVLSDDGQWVPTAPRCAVRSAQP